MRASGLEAKLPISADQFKLLRLFHMLVFENVTLALTFGQQIDQQHTMLQKLAERSADACFPLGIAPKPVTYRELAALYDSMLASPVIQQISVMSQMPLAMPLMPFMQPQAGLIPQFMEAPA